MIGRSHHRPCDEKWALFLHKAGNCTGTQPSTLRITVSNKERAVCCKTNTNQPTQDNYVTNFPSLYDAESSLCGMKMVELLEEEAKNSNQQWWKEYVFLEELRTGQCPYEVSEQTFSRWGLRLDQININWGLKTAARTSSVTTHPPEE